jgi:hypothetical protein
MSLVSEALRKARARTEGGRAPGAVVPPSLVLPPHRHRSGIGIAPLMLVAIAAGLGGAAGVWWTVGRQRPAPVPAAPPATPAVAPTAGGQTAAPPPAATPVAAAPAPGAAAPPRVAAAAPAESTAVGAPASEPELGPAAPPATPELAIAGERRTRDVLIDADVGYAKLHLDYLVYRPGSPFGRVNGQDVIVGSIVEGFKVEEITADYIRLADRRNTVMLRVR